MKKLTIALVAVAMGIAANAASYTWSCTSGRVFDGEGGTTYASVAGQTAYLMFASVLSQADLVSGFNTAGSVSAYTSTVEGKAISTAVLNANARIDGTAASSTVTADQTAYFVVFANDKMYVSSETTAPYLAVGTANVTFSSQSTPSKTTLDAASGYTGAGWYAASVPEPTSGLLMLLGVAGLALRRKRA